MNNSEHKSNVGSDAASIELLPPSFTMRVGKRRLTMSWRARKPVPLLLTGLLHRSWRAMFGRGLRISMTAAAICAAWNVQALAAAPPVNTLPTGGIITSGSATITQNGNTLNINQSSNQAIGNFTTFSIGANATVDISQPSSAAAFLARVTGSDPSLIYGLLKSNGTVALINQNGIMVGPGGVVDVARFIASTLSISDSDFLAGRLTFNAGATAGNIDNQGTIKAATGGSVYLIGANVSNSGVIQSKNGEILLAAGQTVQLVDTATPGVSVNITGSSGNVTNLGTITAEAGRIGIAAGLINNSGNINASSVVSEGGRIFLRASQNLTTTASSDISADGATKGGSVVLYSDKVAYIDGKVSATGAPGQGGFVETSGKTSLDVIKLPSIGSGGTWLIDPYDLEVVGSGGTATTNVSGVITSIGSSAKIEASTITDMLNAATSVTLTTGAGGAASGGNITVSSAINKTSGSAASLTLNANNSIAINADITSTSGALNLNLNSNLSGITGDHTANVSNAQVKLNGGILNVNDGSGSGNGNLAIKNGATIDLSQSSTLNAGQLTVDIGGTLTGDTAGVNLAGDLNNNGTIGLSNAAIGVGGKLINQGTVNLASVSGTLGNVTNSGTLTMNQISLQGGLTATALNNSGSLSLTNTSTLTTGAMTNSGTATISGMSTLNVSTLTNSGTASVSDSTLSATDKITNAGTFTISNGTINTLNGFINSLGATLNLNNLARFDNGGILKNAGTMNVLGSITTNGDVTNDAGGLVNLGSDSNVIMIGGSGGWTNNGTISLIGSSRSVQMTGSTVLTNNGTVTLGGSSSLTLTSMDNSGTLLVNGGFASLQGDDLSNSGTITLGGGGSLVFNNFVTNNNGGNIAGNGSISANGMFTNNGVVSPGGSGAVGALSINGNFTQGTTGVLNIDVASATSYDVLTINSPSTVALGGTLQSKLLGSYVPTLNTRFTPISFANVNAGSSYFRHVLGDVIGTGDNMQMLKVDYKGALALVMSGSADLTYSGNSDSNWGSALSWTGGVLPTAIDNVIVAEGATLSQASGDGVDTVKSITLNDGASLSISGGNTVNVGNIISSGYGSVVITGTAVEGNGGGEGYGGFSYTGGGGGTSSNVGVLNVSGSARISSLALSNGGTLNGGDSSVLNVTNSFAQDSRGVINSNGTVALRSAEGNLTVGNITARNLLLVAQNGAISQNSGSLHVTRQLLASASTGITLGNVGNRIAAFAANNSGINDIVLVNNLELADTSAVKISGVTNANGSISIDNTGAAVTTTLGSGADFLTTLPTEPEGATPTLTSLGIVTNGTISAGMLSHTVTLGTHSPLTIGSGGVTAAGGISLSAGTAGSGLSADSLVINGLITSTNGGTIALTGGGSINVNANISTSGNYTTSMPPVYAPGVSITTASGTTIPVAVVAAAQTSQTVTPGTDTTSQIDRSVNNTQTTTTSSTTSTGTNPVLDNTQTTGGGAGNFGGDDSNESASGQGSNDTKKVVKLYCS